MASQAKLTVRVKSSRGASRIEYSTGGRYVSFNADGYERYLTGQPILGTASLSAFWLAVLAIVQADITANP